MPVARHSSRKRAFAKASDRVSVATVDGVRACLGRAEPVLISFIHSVICLTTGPKPPPKRCLHIVRSFKWEYPLLSLRSSSSFLRLLPRLLATYAATKNTRLKIIHDGLLIKERLVQARKLYFDRAIRLSQRDPSQDCKRRLASKGHLQRRGEFQHRQYSDPVSYPCLSHRKSSCHYRSGKRFATSEKFFFFFGHLEGGHLWPLLLLGGWGGGLYVQLLP